MAIIEERTILSTDGSHTLRGKLYLPESGEVKAVVHVVHGMKEHIGRYDSFMKFLTAYGYAVFGYDHMGHGETAAHGGMFGYIAENGGDQILIRDVNLFAEQIMREFVGKKYIRFGHSMGSFLVRLASLSMVPDALIICGTGGPVAGSGAGIALCTLIKRLKGGQYVSSLIENLIFGRSNDLFLEENNKNAWLCRDESIKAAYAKDPWCTFDFTVAAYEDLIRLNRAANRKKWFDELDKNMPIMLISGSEDPIGGNGKGVTAVYDRLKASGANVKVFKLYQKDRHEILNELNSDEVFADILTFVNEVAEP